MGTSGAAAEGRETGDAGDRGEFASPPRAYQPAPSAGKLLLFVFAFVVFAVIVVGGGVILVAGG
ncbi:hypothetical protein ACIREE_36320 [Streptomyces sp. NPDC102467]|uniref:hypothetical protein n=1 Tax=Streptomyces sp. NPDC102467 TaxID=3366179 RepID=UPI00380AE480